MGEAEVSWLTVALLYGAVIVGLVLLWLAVFAVAGTAITAAMTATITRLFPRRATAAVTDPDADAELERETTETDRLKAMFSTD